jgi:hypothetical protein
MRNNKYVNYIFKLILFSKQNFLTENCRFAICEKMNTIKTKESNCKFSVIGHSLGSLILYDLLSSDNSVSLTKKFNNIKENF